MNIKLLLRKENILPAAFSLVITGLFFLGYRYFGSHFLAALGITEGVVLIALLAIIMFMAGFVVLRALFFVAAEISLLIFLAQSYCGVPHTTSGNQALKSLLFLGFAYILVAFFRKFHEIIKQKYPVIAKERWSKEKLIFVTLFLIFSILLLWQIYLVVNPIVMDLCVYK